MTHAARALGLGVMLGCMVESGLGIAAGCAVAPLCDHVDLDGNLLLRHDPAPGPALVDGIQVPSDGVGLAAGERTLILAEGFSADPHYGKTMRGVLRYRRDDVVAILDSTRAGESESGVPIVGAVDDASAFDPQVALVGVATQGGRFPPAWRELSAPASAVGSPSRTGSTRCSPTTRSCDRSPTRPASSCATCAAPRQAWTARRAQTSRSTRRSC